MHWLIAIICMCLGIGIGVALDRFGMSYATKLIYQIKEDMPEVALHRGENTEQEFTDKEDKEIE